MEQTFSDKMHVLFEKHGNNKCSVKTEKGAVLGMRALPESGVEQAWWDLN